MDVCCSPKEISHGDILCRRPHRGLRMSTAMMRTQIVAVLIGDAVYDRSATSADCPAPLVDRLRHYFLTYNQGPTAPHTPWRSPTSTSDDAQISRIQTITRPPSLPPRRARLARSSPRPGSCRSSVRTLPTPGAHDAPRSLWRKWPSERLTPSRSSRLPDPPPREMPPRPRKQTTDRGGGHDLEGRVPSTHSRRPGHRTCPVCAGQPLVAEGADPIHLFRPGSGGPAHAVVLSSRHRLLRGGRYSARA